MRLAKFREEWMDMTPTLPAPKVDWIKEKRLDVAYGADELQKMDIYYPNTAPQERYPIMIAIHGGGWSHMDKRDWHLYPSFFALEKGFVVASVNYRLIPRHKSPAGINDCSSALEYLIEHADELKIDLSNVFFWGSSAGGNLGAITALKYANDPRLRIQVMVGVSPALDMAPLLDSISKEFKKKRPHFLYRLLLPFFLKKISKDHFGYVIDFEKTPIGPYDASYYLSDTAPRFYFQCGDKDFTTPPGQIEDFAKKLLGHGLTEDDIVLDIIPDAPHMGASHHLFEEDVIKRYTDYCVNIYEDSKN
jgi:acetyl esterase/lipase